MALAIVISPPQQSSQTMQTESNTVSLNKNQIVRVQLSSNSTINREQHHKTQSKSGQTLMAQNLSISAVQAPPNWTTTHAQERRKRKKGPLLVKVRHPYNNRPPSKQKTHTLSMATPPIAIQISNNNNPTCTSQQAVIEELQEQAMVNNINHQLLAAF